MGLAVGLLLRVPLPLRVPPPALLAVSEAVQLCPLSVLLPVGVGWLAVPDNVPLTLLLPPPPPPPAPPVVEPLCVCTALLAVMPAPVALPLPPVALARPLPL